MNEWWLFFYFILLGLLALPMAVYSLGKSNLLRVGVALLFIIALSIAYWHWGSWIDWQQYCQQEANKGQIETVLQKIKSPAELIERMKIRLKQDPKSARGWYLLGRLYASQGQWSKAKDVFFKAKQLSPDDALILVNYAQSLLQLNRQQFNDSVRIVLKNLLEKNPEQPDALAMLAMDAYSNANYQLAIDYWRHLLKLAPSQSEEAQIIRKAIAKAEQQSK